MHPPFAQERLRLRRDGRVALELKTPWHDGTRELVFDPLEFLERLAAMTPRPETNLLICHAVLAPRARWRARVVVYGRVAPRARAHSGAAGRRSREPRRDEQFARLELGGPDERNQVHATAAAGARLDVDSEGEPEQLGPVAEDGTGLGNVAGRSSKSGAMAAPPRAW